MKRLLQAVVAAVPRVWSVLGISLLMIVAIELLATAWLEITGQGEPAEDYRVHADGYRGADWVHAYFKEFDAANHVAWRPYVYWRREPFQGRYLNIDDNGLRRTWNPPAPPTERPPRIFIFGGSTMWGTGARDDYTIASWLSRLLVERHGVVANVTNFAEGGYLSMQELIALESELQGGNVPDLALFLDGVNDVFAAFQNGAPGIPQNEGNRVREFNIRQRIYGEALQTWFRGSSVFAIFGHPPVPGPPPDVDLDELGTAVTTHYAAVVTMINRLAQAYHFRTLFYWQPVIFTKHHRTAYEQGELEKLAFVTTFFENVYGRMRDQSQVRYIGELFADDPSPYFIDFCHLTEAGSQQIAAAMVDDVAAALAAPAR